MSAFFSANSITVNYEQVRAISDVSLTLDAREIIALIGANGAGKTTTLRAITGLNAVTRGEIWFDGQRIDGLSPDRIVELGISMVPEGRHVFPFMSVRDNLLMGAFVRRDKQGIRDDMDKIFGRFPRLEERLGQQAGTMSGGEQQMVAIARALMARPRLLLMDEPSLGLAPIVVQEIARAILKINHEDEVGVILVEQNSRMALKVSDRAYAMQTGKVALHGNSAELANDETIQKLYLGA